MNLTLGLALTEVGVATTPEALLPGVPPGEEQWGHHLTGGLLMAGHRGQGEEGAATEGPDIDVLFLCFLYELKVYENFPAYVIINRFHLTTCDLNHLRF